MRLDKVLADRNYGSRKDVKKYITRNQVTVNNISTTKVGQQINEGDQVCLLDKCFIYTKYSYIILNKPKGYVCANKDNIHKTIFDLLPNIYKKNFHIVGRLDVDTEGLVLITNDGTFTHKVITPSKHIPKVYEVHLEYNIQDHYEEEFLKGIKLSDHICMSSSLQKLSDNICLLTLHEGKFHQVKRMFHAVGNNVIFLKRISIGSLQLGTLPLGEYRIEAKEFVESKVFN